MTEYVDPHVQGLADRLKQLEAEYAKKVAQVEALTRGIEQLGVDIARVRGRFVSALARTSKVTVDEGKAKRASRQRAWNAKARKPGQYVVIAQEQRTRGPVHIGITTEADVRNIVRVNFLCGRGYESIGRDLALTMARNHRGDLSEVFGILRRLTHSRGCPACDGCVTEARKQLRPAKEEGQ